MAERPNWLRVRAPTAAEAAGIASVRGVLRDQGLTTICQGARCPNQVECWSARTATFLLLGDTCTRACRFCAVPHADRGRPLDSAEPERVAAAVRSLGLRYVVLTSVDRDDLADFGSSAIAAAIRAVKRASPATQVEVLLPDFAGDPAALATALASGADAFGHNLETVRRLSPTLRDRRASYEQSLAVLSALSEGAGGRPVKSGLMLGLGEEPAEVRQALADLRAAGVSSVTLGQYLAPTPRSAPVRRYVGPDEFDALGEEARSLGFASVVAGPLVRSSYHAAEAAASCGGSST